MNGVLKKVFILIIAFVIGALFVTESNAYSDPQKRLMARRAAKADALRNLAEMIYGVRIDSRTTVRDFVTESDVIKARLRAVIQGAQEVDYRELPDGSAEVTVEITLGQVRDILGRDLDYDYRTFRATGNGAPPGQYQPTTSAPAPVNGGLLRAKGNGVEPNDPSMSPAERGLMAKRAAKIDALRNLMEQAYGVRIDSNTTVRDFVTQSDDMRARATAYIQGAQVLSERQLPDGSYEVEVGVDTDGLRRVFRR
jgi:hypothetical protein